jgi:SulP family sulfate permease
MSSASAESHRTRQPTPWELIAPRVPIVGWLPTYPRAWLRPELIAALTSWAVGVPVALAYAGLAGMPAEVGLVTAFAALAAYACLGTSRHLRVTASSTMAVMSASVVAPLAGGDPAAFAALTAGLASMVGVMLIAAGLLRLGFLADFLSKPVVTGFVIGLSITIVIGQLPKLLGYPAGSGTLLQQLAQMVQSIPEMNRPTALLGMGTLALMALLKRAAPRVPGALIALVGGIALSAWLGLASQGVGVVGEVATGVPLPGLPHIGLGDVSSLLVGAAGLVVLAGGESLGGARAFAARHHYRLDADQELVALGASNVASGLFGGFAVDASMSQSATGEAAGSRTQLSSLMVSGLMLVTAIALAPLFHDLPQATLAAIVITSVLGLIDPKEVRRYYHWRRTDLAVTLVAMVGVLSTDALTGLLIAAVLSIMALLYRASRPDLVVLGRMPGTDAFVDVGRHAEAEQVEGVLLLRVDTPLYYFNAQEATTQILHRVDQRDGIHVIAMDLGATGDLDVTATDLLAELYGELQRRGITLLLAQVKGTVRDRMRRTGLMAVLGEDHVHPTLAMAVAAAASMVTGTAPSDALDLGEAREVEARPH